jgi:hypothetical protein
LIHHTRTEVAPQLASKFGFEITICGHFRPKILAGATLKKPLRLIFENQKCSIFSHPLNLSHLFMFYHLLMIFIWFFFQ